MKQLFTLLFCLCLTQIAFAQSKVITGSVNDTYGEPVIGATVLVKGTTSGTYVDQNGTFSLKADSKDVLVVKFMGYQTVEVPVGNDTTLEIVMEEDAANIEDVVVIGYGTTTKKSSTGAISIVESSDLMDYTSTSFASAMSGKLTGVQVYQSNGSPGEAAVIRVRGISTLTAGGDPLIVVDGFPLTEGSDLNSINAASIESIQLLKDAASTAIYGSRGANGVVMVTTKGGIKGKPVVSFSASYGIQSSLDNVELVDAYDFAQFQYEARNTGYINIDPTNRSITDTNAERLANGASKRELLQDYLFPYLNGETGLTNTNWEEEVMQFAPVQEYNLNVRGGGDKSSYSITGGYLNQTGILLATGYEKITANLNGEFRPTDNIKIGASFSPSYSTRQTTQSSNTWGGTLLGMAAISYPFFSVYNEDGSYAISEQINAHSETDGALGENPVAWANMLKNETKYARAFGNAYAEVKFFDCVTYKVNVGADYGSSDYEYFKPSDIGQYRDPAPSAAAATSKKASSLNVLIENTLTFDKSFGHNKEHNLQFLLGQSFQEENYTGNTINAMDFAENSIPNIAGGGSYSVSASQYSWSMISYFARLNYNYDNKYILSASMRTDGSSRFGQESKWGLFPAVSGAWVFSNEDFLSSSSILNYGKLRVSYGMSGNNQISNYGSLALMKGSDYVMGGNFVSGTILSTSPNSNLSWEKTATINVGLDVTLFDHLSVTADYYISTTEGLLLEVPVPQQSGYSTSLQNLGKMRNNGFELGISTAKPLTFGDFSWSGSLNITTNVNKVLELAEGQTQIIAGNNITVVGQSIGELYGYEVTGVYKSQEDFDNNPYMSGTQIGDYIIKDLDGDGEITTADKRSYGSAAPDVILGFNNTFTWKNFSLGFDFYGEFGKMKNNATLQSLECGEAFMMITQNYFDNRYHPENNPDGIYATPNMGNYSNARKQAAASNMFFKDASYLSLRTLKLGYDLPTSWVNSLGIQGAQVSVTANNLFYISDYVGYNIEAETSSDPLQQGRESYSYPMTRVISFGINLTF